jgi:hypothetical protein
MEDKKQRIYRIVGILKDDGTEAALKGYAESICTLRDSCN